MKPSNPEVYAEASLSSLMYLDDYQANCWLSEKYIFVTKNTPSLKP